MKDERRKNCAFPIHPSSFILHPSSFVCAPRAEEFLHQLSALFFKHASGNFNAVIQEIGIANSEVRFNRSSPFVARAINQPCDSCLYQRAGAHHTRFDCGINNRVRESVVTELRRRLTQRDNLRMRSWVAVGARSVSRNRQDRFTNHDTSADWNFVSLSCFIGCGDGPAHPLRVEISFPSSTHDGNNSVKQRKNYYRCRAQTLSSEWFCLVLMQCEAGSSEFKQPCPKSRFR
jgi:hypothetical protein